LSRSLNFWWNFVKFAVSGFRGRCLETGCESAVRW